MRVNLRSGGFVCMAGCGARGGDVLAYHMASHGLGFVDAARSLGAWSGSGVPARYKPAPITARQALEVLATEVSIVAVAAADICKGVSPGLDDMSRVLTAAGRINRVQELFV